MLAKLVKIKFQFVKNCGFTKRDVFGFELSALESVSSCENMSVQDMFNESQLYWDATNGLS